MITEILGTLLNFARKANVSLASPYPDLGIEVKHELPYKWRIYHSEEVSCCRRLSVFYNLRIYMISACGTETKNWFEEPLTVQTEAAEASTATPKTHGIRKIKPPKS